MTQITEKMAAARLVRTLQSHHDKLFEAAGKYGGDFPYLEGVVEYACTAILNAIDHLNAVRNDAN